jgi:type II secretory pathway pseudopilin PulG
MRDRRRTSERGQTAVLVALLMVGVLAATGLAIDGGMTMKLRRDAQNAADAAALAAAQKVASYRSGNEVTHHDVMQAANDFAERNGVPDTDGNPGNEINDNVTLRYVDEDNSLLPEHSGGGPPEEATGAYVEVKIEGDPSFIQVVSKAKPLGWAPALAQTGTSEGGVPPSEGPPHALSFVQFEPDCGEGECTVEEPEPDPGEEEYGTTAIERSPGPVFVDYEFENKRHLIKFEGAQIDGEDAGLGEEGACEVDTFEIVLGGDLEDLGGFKFMTKAAGTEDVRRAALDDEELNGDGLEMEGGFWIELFERDGDDGETFTFKVYSCLNSFSVDSEPAIVQ